jgi:hypothetical protein
MTTKLYSYLPPANLTIHPALADFPGLSDDQLAALTISVKAHGIQGRIVCNEEHEVYDGRALLQIAQALDLSVVPVEVRDEKDVLRYAIESAVNRRQLTRSGVVFLLFEKHPELSSTRNKGGRKKLVNNSPVSGAEIASYRDLAAVYRVPREYFVSLCEMQEGMTAEEWAELRRLVLFEEASIPRQYAGFKTGQPAGSNRGAVIYAALGEQGELEGIIPRAFGSIRNGFQNWGDVPTNAQAALEKEWDALLDAAPEKFLQIAARKGLRK